MMGDHRTVYELPAVPLEQARALVHQTLDKWPLLRAVYDDATVEALIARRVSVNTLLLRLIEPNEPGNILFWNQVVDDLTILGGVRALATFRDRMRLERLENMESWLTELRLPARLAREGIKIELEAPTVANKNADFRAMTTPPTLWEIKTPLDIAQVRRNDAFLHDLLERFHKLRQPYDLTLVKYDLTSAELPTAVAEIYRKLLVHAADNGPLPRHFCANGLVVEATGRDANDEGELGVYEAEYVFEGEHVDLVTKTIRAAAEKFPPEGGGIAIIDASNATWLDDTDVKDACFGVPRLIRTPAGDAWGLPGGYFRKTSGTRVSAVIAYRRNIVFPRHPHDIAMFHNPFAKVPLLEGFLALPDVRHGRIVPDGGGHVFRMDPLR